MRRLRTLLLFSLLATVSCGGPAAPPAPAFDVLIRGGTVFDGTGGPGRAADVAIKGDRIAAVGDFRPPAPRR